VLAATNLRAPPYPSQGHKNYHRNDSTNPRIFNCASTALATPLHWPNPRKRNCFPGMVMGLAEIPFSASAATADETIRTRTWLILYEYNIIVTESRYYSYRVLASNLALQLQVKQASDWVYPSVPWMPFADAANRLLVRNLSMATWASGGTSKNSVGRTKKYCQCFGIAQGTRRSEEMGAKLWHGCCVEMGKNQAPCYISRLLILAWFVRFLCTRKVLVVTEKWLARAEA
jgi:hypothetical protein